MSTRVDVIDRNTVVIDFESFVGHEAVIVVGERYDDYLVLYLSDLLSNKNLERCNLSELKSAVEYYNSRTRPCYIELIEG